MHERMIVLIMICCSLIGGTGQAQPAEDSPFQLYTTLVERFYQLNKEAGSRWQEQLEVLDQQRVLDFADLASSGDFERHARAIEHYRQATDTYRAYLDELRQRTTTALSEYDLTAEQLQPVLDNLLKQYQPQRQVLLELLKVHQSYADSMQAFLSFLDKHQQDWTVQSGQVRIDDEQLSQQYNRFIDQMISHEDQIAVLMPRLLNNGR